MVHPDLKLPSEFLGAESNINPNSRQDFNVNTFNDKFVKSTTTNGFTFTRF